MATASMMPIQSDQLTQQEPKRGAYNQEVDRDRRAT
jgi:hypothetical protein